MKFSMIFDDVSLMVFFTLQSVHRVVAKVFRVGRPNVAVCVHGCLVEPNASVWLAVSRR